MVTGALIATAVIAAGAAVHQGVEARNQRKRLEKEGEKAEVAAAQVQTRITTKETVEDRAQSQRRARARQLAVALRAGGRGGPTIAGASVASQAGDSSATRKTLLGQ